jgi:hypothetical protein
MTCSFPIRPNVTCGKRAISAVVGGEGDFYWRCLNHEGELRPADGIAAAPVIDAVRAPRARRSEKVAAQMPVLPLSPEPAVQ